MDKWEIFSKDVRTVFAKAKENGIGLAEDYSLDTPPIANKDKIYFNGVRDEGCESFVLSQKFYRDFDFCKTNERPYDFVVCACLILAKHHFGDKIKVSSGGSPSEWKDALVFVRENFGYGDFPYSQKDVEDGFSSPYNVQYVHNYMAIQEVLGISQ